MPNSYYLYLEDLHNFSIKNETNYRCRGGSVWGMFWQSALSIGMILSLVVKELRC